MDPEDTVIKALQIMHEKKIHRIPVLLKQDNESTVLGILNHQRILRYLVSKVMFFLHAKCG
jgi:CBS domain-containing protein